ncbi:COL12-like protein [Mya arenaria]|uniref:COL12-like protein n=1 Tax=Mya arenaria TaxID=6604 RepID=A0ABY7GBB8_MYAAR|nr:COL12-like protein [Mya arenaria]
MTCHVDGNAVVSLILNESIAVEKIDFIKDVYYVSWEEADKQCKSYPNSNLADLKDAQEQAYVKAYVRDNLLPVLTGIGDGVWLGAREEWLEHWEWVGGRTMDINNFSWLAGNPDNGGGWTDTEDCLEMKMTGVLNDYKCYEKRPFICKMSNIEIPSTTIGMFIGISTFNCFGSNCENIRRNVLLRRTRILMLRPQLE